MWGWIAQLVGPKGAAHLQVGKRGERAAAKHLKRQGYRVLARNARTPIGEVDLICLGPDRNTIVFVEVKSRQRSPDGPRRGMDIAPEARVDRRKRRKLVALAEYLMRANNWQGRPVRIDVVAVEFQAGQRLPTVVRHFENAVGR